MKMNKLILFSFLGFIGASILSIPIQTEISVRKAKKKILEAAQLDEMHEAYGNFQNIKSEEKQRAYLSDTNLTLEHGQQLWVSGQEGISYWNILLITDENGLIVTGDVDRLW